MGPCQTQAGVGSSDSTRELTPVQISLSNRFTKCEQNRTCMALYNVMTYASRSRMS